MANNTIDVKAKVNILTDEAAVKRVNNLTKQLITSSFGKNLGKSSKSLDTLGNSLGNYASKFEKAVDSIRSADTGTFSKTSTLQQILGKDYDASVRVFRNLTRDQIEPLQRYFKDLQGLTKTAVFSKGSDLQKGQSLLKRALGLVDDPRAVQKLLNSPENRRLLSQVQAFEEGRLKQINAARSRLLKSSSEGKQVFGGILTEDADSLRQIGARVKKVDALLNQEKLALQVKRQNEKEERDLLDYKKRRKAVGEALNAKLAAQEEARRVQEQKATKDRRAAAEKAADQQATAEKKASKVAAAERKRLREQRSILEEKRRLEKLSQSRAEVRRGREVLGGSPESVSSIGRRDLVPAVAALNRQKAVLERALGTQLAKSKTSPVAAANARQLEEQLTRVNQALTIGQQRLKGYTGFLHQAAITMKLFFRYALGYGALYQMLAGVRALVGGLVDLDKALFSIQAVAGATTSEMSQVEAAIKRVATTTKFNLAEIAGAAQVLSQAGVEPKDLSKALESVALFAAGTNASLETSADLISTMRNVFKDLSDGQIADQLTRAVNISKLTAEDLKTILSRGLQVAKAYNITSEQFLAATTVLRNAGIKASTVSTGLRQGILELLSPDAKTIKVLRQRYSELGENLTDEEIKSRFFSFKESDSPLVAVLTELKRLGAGGSGAKLFQRLFDVRAENVIKVLSSNLDELNSAAAQLSVPGGAAVAAEIQMKSLANRMSNLGAVVLSLADTLSGGLVGSLSDATKSFTDFLKTIDDGINELKAKTGEGAGGTLLASLAAGGATFFGSKTGGFGSRLAKSAIVGAGTGGVIGLGQESGLSGDSAATFATVAGAASILLSITGAFSKGPTLSKIGALQSAASKFPKLAAIASGFLRFIGGPIGLIITFGTLLASFSGLFTKGDLKTKLEGLNNQIEAERDKLDKLEAEVKDLDAGEAGSFASKAEGLIQKITQSEGQLLEILGGKITDSIQEAVDRLGSTALDSGSSVALSEFSKIEDELGRVLSARERAQIQTISSSIRGQKASLEGLVSTIVDFGQQISDADLSDPATLRKLESINAAFDSVDGGIPKTLDEMEKFVLAFLQTSRRGLADKTKELEEATRGKLVTRTKTEIQLALQSENPKGEVEKLSRRSSLSTKEGSVESLEAQDNFLAALKEVADSNKELRASYEGLRGSLAVNQGRLKARRDQTLLDDLLGSLKQDRETTLSEISSNNTQLQQEVSDAIDTVNRLLSEPDSRLATTEALKARGLQLDTSEGGVPRVVVDNIDELIQKTPTSVDGVTVNRLSSSGKGLVDLAASSERSSSGLKELETLDQTAQQRKLLQINNQIELAKRQENLDLISAEGGLLKQKFDIERAILNTQIERERKVRDSEAAGDVTAARVKHKELLNKRLELEQAYNKELQDSLDATKSQELTEKIDATNIELDGFTQQLSRAEEGSEEYNKLLDEELTSKLNLLDLEFEKANITGKITQVEKDRLAFEKDKLSQDIEDRKREAAIAKIDRDSNDSLRDSKEEVQRKTRGEPSTLEQELGDLRSREQAVQTQIDAREAAKAGASPGRLSELNREIADLNNQLYELQEQQAILSRTLPEQVYGGFDPSVLQAKLENSQHSIRNLATTISDSLTGALDSIGDKFVDAIHNSENFFDSLKDLARNSLLEISRAIINAQINQLLSGALGGLNLPGFQTPSGQGASGQGASAPTASVATDDGSAGRSVIKSGVNVLGQAAGVGSIFSPEEVQGQGCCTKIGEIADTVGESSNIFEKGFEVLKDTFRSVGDSLTGVFDSVFSSGGLFSKLFSGGGGASGGGGGSSSSGFLATAFKAVASYYTGAPAYASGGIISGPGSSTSDSILAGVSGKGGKLKGFIRVSDKEAILNAKAVKNLGPEVIHAANQGRIKRFAEGGMVGKQAGVKSSPLDSLKGSLDNLGNASAAPTKDRIINVLDPSLVGDYLSTSDGERAVLNIMRRNPNSVR